MSRRTGQRRDRATILAFREIAEDHPTGLARSGTHRLEHERIDAALRSRPPAESPQHELVAEAGEEPGEAQATRSARRQLDRHVTALPGQVRWSGAQAGT